jgi:hypothetical protein
VDVGRYRFHRTAEVPHPRGAAHRRRRRPGRDGRRRRVRNFTQKDAAPFFWLFLACGLPAFLVGIAEDLTKKVAARWRLLATSVSAALAVWLLGAVILHTDIPGSTS